MGEVYLAEDTKLNRRVAIKFLPPDLVSDKQANQRLLREAQAAATLDHPNICPVIEVAEADDRVFIVMPYVEGERLDARMKRGALGISESLTIAIQIADALADAHAHGIIHRDIKPSNTIITQRGLAKVMDFGLAKLAEPKTTVSDPEATTHVLLKTEPGVVMGTSAYMSPEQARGVEVDARTDLWSLGVMLYEMIGGRLPFEGQTPTEVIAQVLERQPVPLTQHVPKLHPELQRIVNKA